MVHLKKGYVNCLGALTGGQAVQQAKAGIEAIYLSGWQVAATIIPPRQCIRINRFILRILFQRL